MRCSISDMSIICYLKKIDWRESLEKGSGGAQMWLHRGYRGVPISKRDAVGRHQHPCMWRQFFSVPGRLTPPDNTLTRCWSRTSCRLQQSLKTSLYGRQCKTPSCSSRRSVVEENGIEHMEWPAKYPDCNPMKKLWENIKRKANKKVKDDTSLAMFGGVLAHFAEGHGQPGSTSHTNFDQQYAEEVSRGDQSRLWTYQLLNTSSTVKLIKSKT